MSILAAPTEIKRAAKSFWVESPLYGYQSPMNRLNNFAPHAGEHWRLDIQMAQLCRDDGYKVQAFLSALQGRSGIMSISLARESFSGGSDDDSGTLKTDVSSQTRTLTITGLSTLTTIPAGTLLSVGTLANDDYQVCEVVETATVVSTDATVKLWPRLRSAFSSGAAIAVGTVTGKFRALTDEETHVPRERGIAFASFSFKEYY